MNELIICRHAKSDWSQNLPDIQRPLNDRGLKDAPRMGKLLRAYGVLPDLMISSPAIRAHTTCLEVAKQIGYKEDNIQTERMIYEEGAGAITELIKSLPDEVNSAMLFGHNPTLEVLCKHLLQSRGDIRMPTCAMACFEIMGPWSLLRPGRVTLKWFLIPKLLKGASLD